MTLSSAVDRITYAGTGNTGPFTVPFRFLQPSDLVVAKASATATFPTPLTLNTDYLVAGAGQYTGGSITLTSAIPVGTTIAIWRNPSPLQNTNLQAQGTYQAVSVETALDLLTMQVQALSDAMARSIVAPITDTTITGTLPVAAKRIGTLLGFDSAGNWTTIAPTPLLSSSVTVATIAALKAVVTPVSNDIYTVSGYYTVNDGGGGFFYWNSADTTADNGGTIIQLVGGGTGRWNRLYNTPLDVRYFGAKGDNSTDDRTAITAAATYIGSSGEILFSAGTYKIVSNLTIGCNVRFNPNAILAVPNAVTITLSKGLSAGLTKIFALTGTGIVALSRVSVPVGYPEWWGAATGGVDCLAAINAAIIQCSITELQLGDYYVSGTVLMQTPFRTFRGKGRSWTGIGGTRLLSTSSTLNVLQRGPNSNPGSINGHLQHTYLQDMTLSRTVAIAAGASPAGVLSKYLLFGGVTRVESMESAYCFLMSGVVQDHYYTCYAFRANPGVSPTGDQFKGFFFDGSSGIAAAGGNASVYCTDCTAACSLTAAQLTAGNVGFAFSGGSADTFLLRPEVTSCQQAIVVTGSSGGQAKAGDADLHIVGAVCDGIGTHGIFLSGLSTYASVTIEDCYVAPASGSGAFIGIIVYNSGGMVNIIGGQVVGWPNSSTQGLRIESSSGVTASPILSGCPYPVQLYAACLCKITPQINNPVETCTQGAVFVQASTNRCFIQPTINGGSAVFSYGVYLQGTTNTPNEINCTLIHTPPLSGGAANKLYINGVSVTTTGLSGGNLVSGVMN